MLLRFKNCFNILAASVFSGRCRPFRHFGGDETGQRDWGCIAIVA